MSVPCFFLLHAPSPQGEGMKGRGLFHPAKIPKLSAPAHQLSDNEHVKNRIAINLLVISILIMFCAFGTSLVISESKQYNRTHG